MDAKSIFVSKTFWFNVISAVNFGLNAAGIPTIPPEAADAVTVIGNIVLRFVTKQPVTLGGSGNA